MSSSARLPLIAYALGAGIFLVGTSEFMIAGLLPDIAHDLHTTESHTGLLITAFAVGMLLGAPAMAVLTLRLPRRTTLVAALLVFAAGHAASALADGFWVQLLARFVSAVATGTFWAVAAVVTTAAVPAALRARAISVLIGGLTIANVAGVPLGTFVGGALGWRVTFWILGGAAVVAAVLLLPLVGRVPAAATHARDTGGVRGELAAFRSPQLLFTLLVIAVLQSGMFGAFSYLSPLLTDASGLPKGAVAGILVLFGVGAFAGSAIGGRFGDTSPLRLVRVAIGGAVVTLALLFALGHVAAAVIVLVGLLGIAGFTAAVPLTSRVIGLAGDAPTLASATSTSAFNVGNAVGPWLGGIALAHGGPTAPPAVGAGFAVLALVLALVALRGRAPDTDTAPTRADDRVNEAVCIPT